MLVRWRFKKVRDKPMSLNDKFVINFSELDKQEPEFIGKAAYLLSELKYLKIPIPDGFVITKIFYKEFLEQTGILGKIKEIKKLYHPALENSVDKLFTPVKKLIMYTPIPESLAKEIHNSHKKLSRVFGEASLRVFSSDIGDKSILFPAVSGDANLILKIKTIWSHYLDKPVNVVAQKNIASAIKGKVLTDNTVIRNNLLTREQIEELCNIVRKVRKHFYFPQELEYVIEKRKVYITSIKPLTNVAKPQEIILKNTKKRNVILRGTPLRSGIVTGKTRVIKNNNLNYLKNGEIAVVSKLDESMWKKIKIAKAVVADSTLLKIRDKMILRHYLHAPIIYGAKNATQILQNGNIITVNGINGEIFRGGIN